jgi:hypothetical protein
MAVLGHLLAKGKLLLSATFAPGPSCHASGSVQACTNSHKLGRYQHYRSHLDQGNKLQQSASTRKSPQVGGTSDSSSLVDNDCVSTSRVMKKSKICRKSIEIYGFLRYKMVLAGPKIGTFSAAC